MTTDEYITLARELKKLDEFALTIRLMELLTQARIEGMQELTKSLGVNI